MQPDFKSKKIMLVMKVILMLLSVWGGMFCSLGAKPGYFFPDWNREMRQVYLPLLKEYYYGFKNPFWWISYTNAYTARGILIGFLLGGFFLLYIYTMEGNFIHGKENGTAKYANPYKVNQVLRDKETPADKLHIEKVKRRWFLFLKESGKKK